MLAKIMFQSCLSLSLFECFIIVLALFLRHFYSFFVAFANLWSTRKSPSSNSSQCHHVLAYALHKQPTNNISRITKPFQVFHLRRFPPNSFISIFNALSGEHLNRKCEFGFIWVRTIEHGSLLVHFFFKRKIYNSWIWPRQVFVFMMH